MHNAIVIGDRVRCPGRGDKTGAVTRILRDIGNGQKFAFINLDHGHGRPGILELMPVVELQIMQKKESSHVA